MKKIIGIVITMCICSGIFAQQKIDIADVSKHVGDSVIITAKVYSAKFFDNAKKQPTLLNIGAAFPDQLLTAVIYGEDLKNFKETPVTYFKDKTVTITGKIELYRERPQIVVKDPAGIVINE